MGTKEEAKEEVMFPTRQRRPRSGTASLARTRFGSRKVTAKLRTWSTLHEERPLRRLQHPISPRRRIP
jgi:hypothetical protein